MIFTIIPNSFEIFGNNFSLENRSFYFNVKISPGLLLVERKTKTKEMGIYICSWN